MKYEQFKEIMEHLLNDGIYFYFESLKDDVPVITSIDKYSFNRNDIHVDSNAIEGENWSIGNYYMFDHFFKTKDELHNYLNAYIRKKYDQAINNIKNFKIK